MECDQKRYEQLQIQQEQEWESACVSCGACCGALDDDPCEHLIQISPTRYRCNTYSNRYGTYKTHKGRTLTCVPIRKILHASWPGDRLCAYKSRHLRKAWSPMGKPVFH
ncbi:MAG: hypothetical protein ABIJ41_06500 [Candidatus Omnitrophota bacterium]